MFTDLKWLNDRRHARLGITSAAFLFLAANAPLMAQVVDISIPGGTFVTPWGINKHGFIAGTFYQNSVGYRGFITTVHGQPLYTTIDAPGGLPTRPPPAAAATYAYGINDFGVVAGTIKPYEVPPSGFLRTPLGTFSPIVVPGSTNTQAIGINDFGEVTGYYASTTGPQIQGFIRDLHDRFIAVAYPGALYTLVYGSNVRGELVGEYVDASQAGHAFLFELTSSKFTTLDVPGGGASNALGINDEGDIVGSYPGPHGSLGFIRDANGDLYKFSIPNSQFSAAIGINKLGEIVGVHDQIGFYCRWRPRDEGKDACPVSLIH
jgi:hypothetical protein